MSMKPTHNIAYVKILFYFNIVFTYVATKVGVPINSLLKKNI